ncbi:MAG: AgmX/PglI C-terminal domain-containing protein [Myxococcota bacterium]|nr:AgmX/PglI C-terminal domain-containing protein [Myxococcota bacterium]
MGARSFAVCLALLGCTRPQAPPTAASAPGATSLANAPPTEPTVAPGPTGAVDAGEPVRSSVHLGEIASPVGFDPRPAIESVKPELVACYDVAGATSRALRGKLTLRIEVNEAGAVVHTQLEPGGAHEDPALVACMVAAVAQARFPRPGGRATILAPLVFRSKVVSR